MSRTTDLRRAAARSTTSIARAAAVGAVAAAAAVLPACRTAPPPPEPAPVITEARPALPEEKPEVPQATLRVTGSRVNVREGPATSKPSLAKVKSGDRLALLDQDGAWLKVRLADDRVGWVHSRYVRKDEPCVRDKSGAEILDGPPLSMSEGPALGKVVVEAHVETSGTVSAANVVQNTTGISELEAKAKAEVMQMRFAPPVRNCKPVAFTYRYTRNF